MTRQRLTRNERREQTYKELLEAAARVFSQRGFNGASVDDVAAAAGFTKGAVYAHFASKEELFLALLDRRLEQDIEQWGTIGESQQGQATKDSTTSRSFAGDLEQQRTWNMLLLEFLLYAMRNELVRNKLAARYQAVRRTITERLQTQFAATDTTPELPMEDLAWLIIGLGHGLSLQAYLDPASFPEDLYSRALTSLLRLPQSSD